MNKEEMLTKIKEADNAYYLNDNPIMTDAEYDKLRYDFIAIYGEQELNYVPGGVKSGLKPFKHPFEVVSLDKVKFHENDKLKKNIHKLFPVCIQKKYDGLTLVVYKDKNIVVTRGNGVEGEIVNNFISRYPMSSITSEYPIRGELVMKFSVLNKINEQRRAEGLEEYKNARNASAGIIRSIEKSPYLDELEFYVYDLMDCDMSVEDKIEYLKTHCPFPVTYNFTPKTEEEAIRKIPELYDTFSQEDIPIDGIVIKSNIEGSLKKFGSTAHHPLDAFAWKAFQDGEETILRDVKWQVGRSQITAVAYFDTVKIDGTDVSQASLSNIGIIRKLGLTIGAKVLVNKSNQIIPQIVQVLKDGNTEIIPPSVCPSCGKPLTMTNNVLYCTNDSCKERLLQNIDYMVSKKILNIKGLSESTIEKLIQLKQMASRNEILSVSFDDLMQLEGFAEKSANNISSAIASAKENVDLAHFIASCCIMNIGLDVGKLLMEKFISYDKLLIALEDKEYNFTIIQGIGDTTNELLHSDEFISAYKDLKKYITPIEKNIIVSSTGESFTFVITGKLSKPRDYYKEYIESKGSKVVGSVSKNTNYLLCEDANSTSTKAKKAREIGVKVISEQELFDII